jgi:sensor c-di-GMP phosphodiesterase-like protein
MATRPDCRAIVNSISQLAHQLEIMTTAEGIETAEQLAQVRKAGCGEAQGYYFSTPLPAAEVAPWLSSHPTAMMTKHVSGSFGLFSSARHFDASLASHAGLVP